MPFSKLILEPKYWVLALVGLFLIMLSVATAYLKVALPEAVK